MLNRRFKKVTMILMAAFLVITATPMSVLAGEVTKAATKKPVKKPVQVKPDQKTLDSIKKTETEYKKVREIAENHFDELSNDMDDYLNPLFDDIDQVLDENGLELTDETYEDLKEKYTTVNDGLWEIDDLFTNFENKYKQIQSIKAKNPQGYLKELQKQVAGYKKIERTLVEIEDQYIELCIFTEEIYFEILSDEQEGDPTGELNDDLTDEQYAEPADDQTDDFQELI